MAHTLILASASPRRRDLLAQIGITPDRIVATNIDESPREREAPRPHAARLAREKAAAAATPASYVLAADTVVAIGRRIMPKAETQAQAETCLRLLSGRRHHVFTAITLVAPDGTQAHRLSNTSVIFARLTGADIAAYLETGEWQGKAGGYAIQGRAAIFVRALSGSYSGAVGLPLHETAMLLRGKGYRPSAA